MKKICSLLVMFVLLFACAAVPVHGYTLYEVAVGEVITLTRTQSVSNIYSVTWSADSTAVSIQSQGISSCRIVGKFERERVTVTATIYYHVTSGSYTYTMTTNEAFVVSVVPPAATSISLADSLTLDVGEGHTLTPVINPSNASQNCTWSTSDASVVTVSSSGRVTAIAPGMAYISAKTTNGLAASCVVYVNDIDLALASSSPSIG